jgi:16S rRNA (cytosine967-C5)-methyltransferase
MQDIGSQSIVPLLRLQPGQSFLDVCAAPGNKTAQALEASVSAIACDVHYRRLLSLKPLGVPLVVLDSSRELPFRARFERILLDAPCSGTGTLARNPEIKWRLEPSDPLRLQQIQRALLRQAYAALAPGGLLVYSTCSLEREENEEVVAVLPPGALVRTLHRIPGRDPGDGFFAAVIKSE